MPKLTRMAGIGLVIVGLASMGGCPRLDGDDLEDLLEEAADAVNNVIDNFQEQNPFVAPDFVDLPAGVIVDGTANTIFIDDFVADVPADSLLDSTYVALTNDTGFDIVVEYRVVIGSLIYDEAAFVYDLETVLLSYPCADYVEIIAEYDFDPFTGEFIQDFTYEDLVQALYSDYECSDMLEFVFTPDFVDASVTIVDLVQQ